MEIHEKATEIAGKWGPALTKALTEDDLTEFRSLFVDDLVEVVLQDGVGEEAAFTVADSEDANLSWITFHELTTKDGQEQGYAKTEAQCLGVLADRMIIETARFNKDGEIYLEAYALVTFNADGKVTCLESFTDPKVANLIAAGTEAAEDPGKFIQPSSEMV